MLTKTRCDSNRTNVGSVLVTRKPHDSTKKSNAVRTASAKPSCALSFFTLVENIVPTVIDLEDASFDHRCCIAIRGYEATLSQRAGSRYSFLIALLQD